MKFYGKVTVDDVSYVWFSEIEGRFNEQVIKCLKSLIKTKHIEIFILDNKNTRLIDYDLWTAVQYSRYMKQKMIMAGGIEEFQKNPSALTKTEFISADLLTWGKLILKSDDLAKFNVISESSENQQPDPTKRLLIKDDHISNAINIVITRINKENKPKRQVTRAWVTNILYENGFKVTQRSKYAGKVWTAIPEAMKSDGGNPKLNPEPTD